MTPAARIAAAIEVLELLNTHRRPLPDVLKEWGFTHRFAGSKDRASIGTLCFDALRKKASSQALMGEETARASVIGMLYQTQKLDLSQIEALFSEGGKYAPLPINEAEKQALSQGFIALKPHIKANIPAWLYDKFGANALEEGEALAERAPLDIRVNRLKTTRDALMETLKVFNPVKTPYSEDGLRFLSDGHGRFPAVTQEIAFMEGHFEVQDEGSQLIATLVKAQKDEIIIDLCAGGGGKALALAAIMENTGKIYATDIDRRRLTPLHERMKRAGAMSIDIMLPATREHEPLVNITADCVMIDAPCTGIGTWRRNPDAKWRLREGALSERLRDQQEVLTRASKLLKGFAA
jgi:16S rRNA (cytosine967-C5)-methyltransferase